MNAPSQPNLHQPVPQFGTPQPDYAVTYVTNEAQGDVHVFVPDGYDIDFVRDIAQNFRYDTPAGKIWKHSDKLY